MGLLQTISRLGQRWLGNNRFDDPHSTVHRLHICRYEEIEPRHLMAADLQVAAVYYDPASGLDHVPNVIQVQFQGGVAGTELNHLTINGSKDGGKLTFNDAIFDTAAGGLGAYGFSPFKVVSSDGFQVLGAHVVDGGTALDIDFKGFKAGMTLVFSIDVDQVLFIDTAAVHGDVEVDAVDEGAEFQRSHLTALFSAEHYEDLTTTTQFWDKFDANFSAADAASHLHVNLPKDSYSDPTKDQSVLTAGAVAVAQQKALPNSLSGVVFADNNLNNHQDPGDTGIANVNLALYVFDGTQYVPTMLTTVTDSQGSYRFNNLAIGKYRVVETQPTGYFSVGAQAGTVKGQVRGVVSTPDIITDATLLGGDDSVHNDFAEALPNSIAGHVGVDTTDDCGDGATTPPISGVVIRLFDASGKTVATTTTDKNGNYQFTNLAAGNYTVFEEQPAGYFDGDEHVGSVGGEIKADDTIWKIQLTTKMNGVNYNFCELLPASISGYVHIDTNGDCENNPNAPPIAGVTIHLLDASGRVIGTTRTDSQGKYIFTNLVPGTYGIHEDQPAGYFDGDEHAGSAGGDVADDLITHIVLLSGVNAVRYDFCELLPVSISGHVGVDTTGDCQGGTDTPPIAGVVIQLLDASGKVVGTTMTDAAGNYKFAGLAPGTYGVHEVQPSGYLQDDSHPGSVGGVVSAIDTITSVVLPTGTDAVHYNFCEVLPVGISGYVHIDTTGDCESNPDAPPLAGVTIHLLDSQGKVIGTTQTDARGHYDFDQLPPGTYGVREEQPANYLNGDTHVGSVGGTLGDDLVTSIVLLSGVQGVHYDFCEVPPASLCGYVYVDLNNNGHKDAGEAGIGNVTLILKGADGQPTGATTITDATGRYCFMGLRAGTYGVAEIQPSGYFDGLDEAGDAGGTAMNPGDMITGAVLTAGMDADNYNFGELPPASISGNVHARHGNDCDIEDGATPLSGVVMHLLDSTGKVLATTTTNVEGAYQFNDLAPGTYSVLEEQPVGLFDGDADVGSVGGTAASGNLIGGIALGAGVHAVHYDFCEIPPATLSGNVFQDGPPIVVEHAGDVPDVKSLRDGKLTPDDTLLKGVPLALVDGVTGQPILGSAALPGYYTANLPITTITDGNGHYVFNGLPPGVYGVFDVKPGGYFTGIDTPGSLGGVVISTLVVTDPAVIEQLQVLPHDDALVAITLLSGDNSINNNFSVVTTTVLPPVPIIFPPVSQPPPVFSPAVFILPVELPPPPDVTLPYIVQRILTRSGGALYTWHLSIVDAGQPRSLGSDDEPIVKLTSMKPEDEIVWEDGDLTDGEWTLGADVDSAGRIKGRKIRFGLKHGIPISGDFNGDGKSEVGFFKDGRWFIDLNDNGVWDEGDLWAKLGHKGDRPVTGDWDGDGKTDIGIYGPAWSGDPRAIAHEPGMPDPHNENTDVHKNIPRAPERTTRGKRTMKLTANGQPRADLIDHVFLYGTPGDHPVVGDWNGDGTATIGVFRDGVWHRDLDGNGKWSKADTKAHFGQPGDIPVAGDFNGDGIEELGIFRDGMWYIDTNGNGKIDAEDRVFKLGEAGDLPVVGDWNGDGKAEPGVYHATAATVAQAPSK